MENNKSPALQINMQISNIMGIKEFLLMSKAKRDIEF